MSGVEIASLALGVLPILIAAAEHIKSRRLDPRRAVFMENLAFEIVFLHMSLTKLAKGLTELPDETREKLISSQATQDMDASWKRDEVKHALKARLGSGHETFIVTLRAILDCLERLLEKKSFSLSNDKTISAEQAYAKLRSIRDTKATTQSKALGQRVRFAIFEARVCDQILIKITQNNERLERIVLWSSDALTPVLEPSQDKRAIDNPHEMSLTVAGLKVNYALLFNSFFYRDLTPQPTRGVRFDVQTATSPVEIIDNVEMVPVSPTGTNSTMKSGRRRASTTTRQKIQTLCQTLLQANRNLCSPQILFDGGCLWHISSKPSSLNASPALSIQANEVDTSLASLLRGERKFRPKEKRILSVILANSLLQFCESPWLSKDWNKDHISFFPSSAKGGLDIQRPYLTTNFQEGGWEEEADALYRVHPNASVLALGILLLEIELDTPIERERGAEDLDDEGMPTVNTDYFAALRLFEGISDDFYLNHRQAVAACLNCDFYDEETMRPSLDDPGFRQAVYNTIVRPLEQELLSAYDLTPDDLGLNIL
ncbi:hypothetical protein DE146DRAFT_632945 [Phaeosphaeria sp. MPI-PUGE-AT-0046c]|nr:hypothetical protein DE146DRAFT_632945 [Phaeosphaeria sp. MPI-PUGE-AT-0046c]